MMVGHAIVQHSCRHAHVIEPLGEIVPLISVGQTDVGTAGGNEQHLTVRLFGRIDKQFRLRHILCPCWIHHRQCALAAGLRGSAVGPEINFYRAGELRKLRSDIVLRHDTDDGHDKCSKSE